MRILLDECIDRRLAKDIVGHEVKTAPQMGWTTIKNGDLVALAAKQFGVFVTVDRNLSFPAESARFDITVLVLCANNNRMRDLRPLVPKLLHALPNAQRGEASRISI